MKKTYSTILAVVFLIPFLISPVDALSCINTDIPIYKDIKIKCLIDPIILEKNDYCLDDKCITKIDKGVESSTISYLESGLNYNKQYVGVAKIKNNEISFYKADGRGGGANTAIIEKQEILDALNVLCAGGIEDIKPIFTQEIERKISGKELGGFFVDGDIIFEPYSQSREFELTNQKSEFEKCRYFDFKRAGNWLIVSEETRNYCYVKSEFWKCDSKVISQPKFFLFLLTNPSNATLPHFLPLLLKYLLTTTLIIGAIVSIVKIKELRHSLKPSWFNIITTLVLSVSTLLFYANYGIWYVSATRNIALYHIGGYYLISSLVKYIYLKIKSRPTATTFKPKI